MDWLVVVVGILAVLVLGSRSSAMQRRIAALEAEVRGLSARLGGTGVAPEAPPRSTAWERAARPAPTSAPEAVEIPAELPTAGASPAVVHEAPPLATEVEAPGEPAPARRPAWPKADNVAASASSGSAAKGDLSPGPPPSAEPDGRSRQPVDWERTLGVRLPVWGGAIMLLIAGLFLINWAIESGALLFTPEVRVLLCGLAAAGLLGAAFLVKARGIANGDRIASALAAAGIAVGYGTMFLAAGVFRLVPDVVGLAGAGLVTLLAIGIASRFGQRVMLVGLLGGYLSPLFAWMPGTSSGVVPTYVVVLLAVSMFAIRRNGWWGQVIPAMVAPALWGLALVWGTDAVSLAVLYLLLAVVPSVAGLWPDKGAVEALKGNLALPGFAASALCLVLGVHVHGFHAALLVAVVLLGAGGAALVVRYGAAQWPAWLASLAAGLVVLVSWETPEGTVFLSLTVLLAAIHLGALVAQFRAEEGRVRRAFEIAALSVLLFVILLVKLDGWLGARDVPYLWAVIALAVAGLFGWLALSLSKPEVAASPAAGFAVGASAFLSLALGLVLDPGLYALTAALQAFGLSLLYLRYRMPVLRQMHVAYLVLYGVLLVVGQVVSQACFWFGETTGCSASFRGSFIPAVGFNQAPITLLLLPGLLLLGASTIFTRVAYSALPRALDVIGVVLLAAAVHFMSVASFDRLLDQPLVDGLWWFNGLAALALGASYAASRAGRTMMLRAGLGVAVAVGAVMVVAVFLPVFRFWQELDVPGPPVLNAALLGIGLPSLLLLGVAYLSRGQGAMQIARGLAAFGGLGGLVTILVVIRQAIHGPTLMGPGNVPGQVELYVYSVAMLAYGFALLWGGIAFSSLALRAGSLVVVLATIGKVFFYDIGGLEGLWRVGSFLGLGIALLAVSWFYGRFVFGLGPSGARRNVPQSAP